jgi:diaminopimelate epimerase
VSKVMIAVVYVTDVLPGEDDVQVETFERFVGELPACPNAEVAFATGVLVFDERKALEDFDVDVRFHGRTLEPVPYQE